MIVWTPNRDPFKDQPTAGGVVVTTIPEPSELKAHPMSAGACDLSWREADDNGRRALMQRYFTQMVHRDGLKEEAVRAALSVIEDFRGYSFSAAEPDPEDQSWL